MSMRPVFDPSGGPDLLVTQLIGKAYDTVRRVSLSLPELQRLDGVLGEIDGLAQTTVDHALSVALPVFVAEVQQHADEAKVWADASGVSAADSAASAEEAKQAALDSVKTNLMYQFEFKVGQFIYDVTAIAGRTDITTGGMALVVNGLVDYDFTIIDETTFRLNNQGKYPDGTVMRLLINARFDDVFTSIKELEEMITRQFQEQLANSAMEVPVPYAPGINITRATQTVTYLGRDYRVNIPYLPLVTSTWSVDGPKMVLAGDGPLRQQLLEPDGAGRVKNGSETVATSLDRVGKQNQYAWGGVKQNDTDFASFGPNLAPAFNVFEKVNFSATGVHGAGTVATLTAPVSLPAFSFFKLTLTVLTTAPGGIQVSMGDQRVFSDTPNGYVFSNATFLADGIEQDRVLSTTVYTFMAETSGAPQTSLTITTDLLWAGQLSAVEICKVDPTKFSVAGAGTGNGVHNPIGMKAVGYNRNDVVLGDKYTLGMLYDDGLPLMGAHNVAIGSRALGSNVFGNENTAVGTYSLQYNEGTNNVAVGYSALKLNTKGQENTAIGFKAGVLNTTGYRNTYSGFWCFGQQTTGEENTGMGWFAARNFKLGARNTCLGSRAGQMLGQGDDNTCLGALAGFAEGEGVSTYSGIVAVGAQAVPHGAASIAIGYAAKVGVLGTPSAGSIAIGQQAIAQGVTPSVAVGKAAQATGARAVVVGEGTIGAGQQSTAIGALAQANGAYTTSLGSQAGLNNTGTRNTFVGPGAGAGANAYSNITVIGSFAQVTGNNQIQLGDSATTTYVYGTVQNRSDLRDKADVTKTELGLKFIMGLKPIQGRWDIRSDYSVQDADGNVIVYPQDGRFKRKRIHQWFGAQDVIALCVEQGVEFGGVQDHTVAEGEEVLSIGYDEFIPPIVKAMQEQNARLDEQDERLTRIEEMLKELLEK